MSCESCHRPTTGRCGECRIAYYCGPACQAAHRANHASLCDQIAPHMRRFIFQEQEQNRCGYDPTQAAQLRERLAAFHTSHPELDNTVRMAMEIAIRTAHLDACNEQPKCSLPTPMSPEYRQAMRDLYDI